jgi:hypothetical protein
VRVRLLTVGRSSRRVSILDLHAARPWTSSRRREGRAAAYRDSVSRPAVCCGWALVFELRGPSPRCSRRCPLALHRYGVAGRTRCGCGRKGIPVVTGRAARSRPTGARNPPQGRQPGDRAALRPIGRRVAAARDEPAAYRDAVRCLLTVGRSSRWVSIRGTASQAQPWRYSTSRRMPFATAALRTSSSRREERAAAYRDAAALGRRVGRAPARGRIETPRACR